jgi:hypothetical protein
MNLTIQQVSKITKLSVPTLYTYASRLKLGKKVGNRKVFSQADVRRLLKSSRKSTQKKKAKLSVKEPIKKTIKRAVTYASKPVVAETKSKRPFWTRLLFGKRSIK